MHILCPMCEKITDCEFQAELYFCKECQEDFANYEKPAEQELMKFSEILNQRLATVQFHDDATKKAMQSLQLAREQDLKDYKKQISLFYDRLSEEGKRVLRLSKMIAECESALISMVQQYCYRPIDSNNEPAVDIYQHDFMSAGEEAFAYLVKYSLGRWTNEHKDSIVFVERKGL